MENSSPVILSKTQPDKFNIIHTKKGYMCSFCFKLYKYQAALYSHFRNGCQAWSRQRDLGFSDLSLSKVNIVEIDTVSIEKKKGQLRCKHCPKMFSRKVDLEAHEGVHLKRFFSCNNCLRLYKDQETLDKHKKICSVQKYAMEDCEFRPSMIFLPQYEEPRKWRPVTECKCGCNVSRHEELTDLSAI